MEGCAELGLTSDEMEQQWAKCKAAKKMVKFGGGFYCGLIEGLQGHQPAFVFNGFFMSMRSKYTQEASSISWLVVEWDAKSLAWKVN
jgi:hypothetical protein